MTIHVALTDSGTSSMSVLIMYTMNSYLQVSGNLGGHVPEQIGSLYLTLLACLYD